MNSQKLTEKHLILTCSTSVLTFFIDEELLRNVVLGVISGTGH